MMRVRDKLPFYVLIGVNTYLIFTGGQPEYEITSGQAWLALMVVWVGYQVISTLSDKDSSDVR